MSAAIGTEGPRKSYGKCKALRGVDLPVPPGMVLGVLGRNGAVDGDLAGRENLVLLGKLLHLGRRTAKARAVELLAQFDLADASAANGSKSW